MVKTLSLQAFDEWAKENEARLFYIGERYYPKGLNEYVAMTKDGFYLVWAYHNTETMEAYEIDAIPEEEAISFVKAYAPKTVAEQFYALRVAPRCAVCGHVSSFPGEGRRIDGSWAEDYAIPKDYWGKWVCCWNCYREILKEVEGVKA